MKDPHNLGKLREALTEAAEKLGHHIGFEIFTPLPPSNLTPGEMTIKIEAYVILDRRKPR